MEAERARQSSDILRRNRKLVARLTPEVLTRQLSMRKVRRVVVRLLVPTQRTAITIPGYSCAQAKLDEQLEVVAMRGRYRKAKRIEGKAQATGKVRRLKLMQERKAQKLQYSWYGTRKCSLMWRVELDRHFVRGHRLVLVAQFSRLRTHTKLVKERKYYDEMKLARQAGAKTIYRALRFVPHTSARGPVRH